MSGVAKFEELCLIIPYFKFFIMYEALSDSDSCKQCMTLKLKRLK